MPLSLTARSLLTAFALASPTAQAQAPSAFDLAMQAYTRQHFREAFDGLARLADQGHRDAARIALLMVSHGARLFGQRFEIAPPQRERWLDLASAAER
jgi:hypothetical protein